MSQQQGQSDSSNPDGERDSSNESETAVIHGENHVGYLAPSWGFIGWSFLLEHAGLCLSPSILAAETTVVVVPHVTIVGAA